MNSSASDDRRSIAQVNRMIRSIIEAETLENFFWVGGPIDRFYWSDLGHVYFDLADDKSRIRCMMPEERASQISTELHNQRDIEVYGDVHCYEDRAEAQINVMDLRVTDVSADLTPAIDRLRAEGLYPPTKKPPPARIRRVGIITSRSSRAIGDFESAYQSAGERGVLAPVVWKYVTLEGDRALQSIVDAIAALDEDPEIDVLAIVRGGGRSENLAVFETHEIAAAIISCNTYCVTGIGHHRDSTLADEVADYAASTPTAVAHYLADLCLRSMPEALATTGRASMPSRDEGIVSPSLTQASRSPPATPDASDAKSQTQNGTDASRLPVVLVWLLIVLSIAAVILLAAVLLTQMR